MPTLSEYAVFRRGLPAKASKPSPDLERNVRRFDWLVAVRIRLSRRCSSTIWSRAAFRLTLLATSCTLVGCGPSTRDIHFREEIQLQDNQSIVAERSLTIKTLGGEIGGPGGWEPLYESLEVVGPQHSDLPPKWSSSDGLIPVLLDHAPDSGQWTLLTTFIMCEPWVKYGRPKIPYVEFRIREGRWQQVEFSSVWLGRKTNVFTGIRSRGEPATLSIEDKVKRADSRTAKWYVQIEDHWLSGC